MIAIVGAALRLPGATSMEAFWDRLLAAGDTITRAPDAVPDYEQQPLGVADNARFVPAYGRIDGVTEFDHERFQMAPAEAMLTDPQQRVLLEVVDEALYTAAVSAGGRAATSLFAGTGLNTYEATIRRHLAGAPGTDELAVELGTARDYAAGRIAYRLGLGGAAVNVLAACSTGLVAVHLGCRTLLQDEADVAVAAVSAIRFPEWHGYWAAPGGISSPDGVCRPFDARAAGTVPADGVAAVVLKRMPDALAAGDDVLAVILGSALNNDGRKGGFGDVSAAAQEAVIGAALNSAGVDPAAVAYVESHGTATRLGDVVEWAALQRVFGHNDRPVHVGAVKGNLGHTREAAGMAGLLKAVAVMRHGVVPPSANFDSLAGELSSDRSPLRPVAEATPLDGPDAEPLAGVSAFGLGGTNAHVVLRSAPARPEPAGGEEGVILLSSPRLASLDAETDAVHRLVDGTPDVAAGVAARSQVRAHPHAYRRYVALEPTRDRAAAFSKRALDQASRRTSRRPADVAFVFPGVGAEYAGMGAGLAGAAAAFRRSLAETVQLSAAAGVDIEPLLARPERAGAGVTDFDRMLRRSGHGAAADSPPAAVPVRHLALFAVQLALVDLLEDLGIRPAAVAGHSLGEWTAATVAGVLRRGDAVALLARRARLIEQAPCGATLAVAAAAAGVAPLLGPGAAIAADNSPQSCSVSGSDEAIDELERRLDDAGLVFRRLDTRAAFHNEQLAAAGAALGTELRAVDLSPPAIPMASGMTGSWLGQHEVDAGYWQAQLERPVLFRQALEAVCARHRVIVEVGPGTIRPWTQQIASVEAIRTLRLDYVGLDDLTVLRRALADLWLHGHEPRWPADAAPARTPEHPLRPALERTVFDPRRVDGEAPARARAQPARAPAVAAAAPTLGDMTGRLAELWCAVLGVDEVGGEDHFFDLGGDSLLGRHLIAMIERLAGAEVPGEVVFASATLDGMAASIHAWATRRGAAHA